MFWFSMLIFFVKVWWVCFFYCSWFRFTFLYFIFCDLQVKFVKEILFSKCDRVKLTGKNARRMRKHLSISADDDVQRTLSYFEKVFEFVSF